jgi:prefoldin subunit 5
MLFICDYIQVKKDAFDLNRLRQEARFQKSQIQFFTTRIEELEGQISKLMDFDKRIRIIANLERNQEMVPFIGMGGTLSTDRNDPLNTE